MGAYYASAYRAANWGHASWASASGFTIDSDPDGLLDDTANLEFTAPEDGMLIWSQTAKWTVEKYDAVLNRHYIDDVLWPAGWTNRYNGGQLSTHVANYPSTYYAHIPMATGEVHRWDNWVELSGDLLLGGTDYHNIRYLFIPTGEGPTTQILGMSANLGPWAAATTWRRLTGFDRPMTTDTSWIGVDEETFTMPGDGWIIVSYQQEDTTDLNQQKQTYHLKVEINADGGILKHIGGRKSQRSSWQQRVPSPIVPVSSGDEILIDWAMGSHSGADTFEHRGYDSLADGIEHTYIAIQHFS